MGCHNDEGRGNHVGKQCFIHLHDDASFGLGWKDKYELFGGDQVEVRTSWKSPTDDQLKAHAAHIDKIKNPNTRYSLRSRLEDAVDTVEDDEADNATEETA